MGEGADELAGRTFGGPAAGDWRDRGGLYVFEERERFNGFDLRLRDCEHNTEARALLENASLLRPDDSLARDTSSGPSVASLLA